MFIVLSSSADRVGQILRLQGDPRRLSEVDEDTIPTAALIIVGNEVLSAKVADVNGPWAAQRCRALGLDLGRIVVIPDSLPEIAAEVAACSGRFDWVFTSGGVGPTHDDVTLAGIALGLGLGLERNAHLAALIQGKLGDAANDEAMRMADVPAGSALWQIDGLGFPQVVAGNVLPLPGVPSLFRRRFDGVAPRFAGVRIESRRVTTRQRESDIAAALRALDLRFPQVEIGSYPQFDTEPWTVTVTLDSRDPAALEQCHRELEAALDPALLVR
jgi:molybdopterin-biosynthesis enzyme MoeA-like protein